MTSLSAGLESVNQSALVGLSVMLVGPDWRGEWAGGSADSRFPDRPVRLSVGLASLVVGSSSRLV